MTWESEPEILLKRGWWTDHHWHRQVHLRPVDDAADESLLEQIEGMHSVERDTALLTSLVCGPEGKAATSAQIRELSMGDRELLLLLVRRRLFGNIMQCVLKCPSCEEKLDVELRVDDLIVESHAPQQIRYEELIEAEDGQFRVIFHLPTGGEVEKVLHQAPADVEGAEKALAGGCIDSMSRVTDAPESPGGRNEECPDSVLRKIAARIEQLDPQAEIQLQSECPECGCEFKQSVDPGGYLVHELAARQRLKYQEVHQLARAYHWSESEILRMGSRKRQIYLDLLATNYE
jgi:hypothetical protein